jgi:hypothetical protein
MVLTPLSTIFQLYRCGQFISGGNRSIRWKPPTCRKSLTNFIVKTTDMPQVTDKLYRENHRHAASHWRTLSWKSPTCRKSLTNFIVKTTDMSQVTDKLYRENHRHAASHWQTLSHNGRCTKINGRSDAYGHVRLSPMLAGSKQHIY